MKRFVLILSLVLVAAAAMAYMKTGYGREVAVKDTVPTVVEIPDGDSANSVSVYNSGAGTLYALVDCSSNVFVARVAAGTCIPIAASQVYTFDTAGRKSIAAVWLQSATGSTNAVKVGAY